MLDFGMHRSHSSDAIMGNQHRANRTELLYTALTGAQRTSSRGTIMHPEPQTHSLPLHRGNRGALLAEAMHSYVRRRSSTSSSFKNIMKFVSHTGAAVAPEQISAQQAAKKALHSCALEYHEGTSKKWHKAWCAVTSEGMLYMFHNDHSATAEQILPLEHARLVDEDMEHPLCIFVEVTHGADDSHVLGMQLRLANIAQKREFTECMRRGKIEAALAHGGHSGTQDSDEHA